MTTTVDANLTYEGNFCVADTLKEFHEDCIKGRKLEREVFWARPGDQAKNAENETSVIDLENSVVVSSDSEHGFSMEGGNLTKVIFL